MCGQRAEVWNTKPIPRSEGGIDRARIVSQFSIKDYRPLIRGLKACDEAEEGGLTAPRGAGYGDTGMVGNNQRDPVYRDNIPITLPDAIKFNHCVSHRSCPEVSFGR